MMSSRSCVQNAASPPRSVARPISRNALSGSSPEVKPSKSPAPTSISLPLSLHAHSTTHSFALPVHFRPYELGIGLSYPHRKHSRQPPDRAAMAIQLLRASYRTSHALTPPACTRSSRGSSNEAVASLEAMWSKLGTVQAAVEAAQQHLHQIMAMWNQRLPRRGTVNHRKRRLWRPWQVGQRVLGRTFGKMKTRVHAVLLEHREALGTRFTGHLLLPSSPPLFRPRHRRPRRPGLRPAPLLHIPISALRLTTVHGGEEGDGKHHRDVSLRRLPPFSLVAHQPMARMQLLRGALAASRLKLWNHAGGAEWGVGQRFLFGCMG